MSRSLGIAFSALRGLEDYACECVLEALRDAWPSDLNDTLLVSCSLLSGHVLIRFTGSAEIAQRALSACRQCYESGAMKGIEKASIMIAEGEFEGTRQLLEDAFTQKLQSTNAKGRRIRGEHVRMDGERLIDASQKGFVRTPADLALLQDISRFVSEHLPDLELAHSTLAPSFTNPTFRGSAENPSNIVPIPSLKTRDLACTVGESVSDWLDEFDPKRWKVDLENPAFDVELRLFGVPLDWGTRQLRSEPTTPPHLPSTRQSQQPFPSCLCALLAVVLPSPPSRTVGMEAGRTSLLKSTAHLLTRIHPYFTPFSIHAQKLLPGAILLDPCAGTGAIPFQMLQLAYSPSLSTSKTYPLVLAGDNDPPNLLRIASSLRNIPHANKLGVIQPFIWDASARVSATLREGLVDGIISDLPWGNRELSPNAIAKLYPPMLAHLSHISKEGAWAVLVTAASPLLRRCLAQAQENVVAKKTGRFWVQVDMASDLGNLNLPLLGDKKETGNREKGGKIDKVLEREIYIGGMRVCVFLLRNQRFTESTLNKDSHG